MIGVLVSLLIPSITRSNFAQIVSLLPETTTRVSFVWFPRQQESLNYHSLPCSPTSKQRKSFLANQDAQNQVMMCIWFTSQSGRWGTIKTCYPASRLSQKTNPFALVPLQVRGIFWSSQELGKNSDWQYGTDAFLYCHLLLAGTWKK